MWAISVFGEAKHLVCQYILNNILKKWYTKEINNSRRQGGRWAGTGSQRPLRHAEEFWYYSKCGGKLVRFPLLQLLCGEWIEGRQKWKWEGQLQGYSRSDNILDWCGDSEDREMDWSEMNVNIKLNACCVWDGNWKWGVKYAFQVFGFSNRINGTYWNQSRFVD